MGSFLPIFTTIGPRTGLRDFGCVQGWVRESKVTNFVPIEVATPLIFWDFMGFSVLDRGHGTPKARLGLRFRGQDLRGNSPP